MPLSTRAALTLLFFMTLAAPGRAEGSTGTRFIAPHPPWAILNLSYGAGALEYYNDQEATIPATLTLQPGFRFRQVRVGMTALRWIHTGDADNFLESGFFVGADIFSIEQDEHRSAALYGRLDASARFSLDRDDSFSLVFGGFLGIRLFGIFLEAGFGPVIGPFDVADLNKNPWGMTGEGRAGVELVEFISCFSASCFKGGK